MRLVPLNNFGFLAPNLARGAQPDPQGFRDLVALGFTFTYKLNDEAEYPIAAEARFFTGEVVSDPYPTFSPDPVRVRRSVQQIRDLLEGGARVFLHCTHGRDRTGLIAGAYRLIIDRWTLEAVDEERAAYGVLGLVRFADEPIHCCLATIAKEEGLAP